MSIKLKTHSLLLFGLVSYGIFSCQEVPQVDYVLFSGKISNTESSYVTVKNDNFSYDIDLNSNGTFSDTLRIERGFYRFYSGRERTNIFLDQGFVIDLSIDQPQFDETLAFNGEGKGTRTNGYLANKARLDEQLTVDFQTLFSKDEPEFIATVESWKTQMETLLQSSNIDDDQFTETEKRSLKYEYLTQFVNYEYYHQYATKDATFKVSDSFDKNLVDIDLNNEEDFNKISNYKNLLKSYFEAMIEKGEVKAAFESIRSIKSSIIKEGLVPSYTYNVEPGNAAAEDIYQGILSVTRDSATIAKLTEKIEKIRKLQKGMPSANFAYQSIEGETISLDDLQGKYLYVDVWATWCGPCIREIPSLKSLESDYHNAPIEFVSISIDAEKDFEKWQQMIADKDLQGVQLFADNSWQSDFVKAYAIDGIPRFIIIDPDGNILDPNAPRPSDPAIRELFNGLEVKS